MIPFSRVVELEADRTRSSPNHGARSGFGISLIVLHATADGGNERGAEEWMANRTAQASCHLHFRRDGTVTRMVADNRRAWHAGVSKWPDVADVNSASLGWEIANKNDGKEPYTDKQYAAVARALKHYLPQGIQRGGVVTHAMVSPGRKTDPAGWSYLRMWAELDKKTPDIEPQPTPKVPISLDRIENPTPEHINEIIRVRRLDPDEAAIGIAVAEVLARGVVNADVSRKAEVVKRTADALSDWLRARMPPAA